jgi:hypothetical protein
VYCVRLVRILIHYIHSFIVLQHLQLISYSMASERTVLRIMGKALWDTRPTTTDLSARQLAVALGYPESWRVVRSIETNESEASASVSTPNPNHKIIVDRIYAGLPDSMCDMWFHHTAAMQVAATWGSVESGEGENVESTPFDQKGGHLLPRLPQFDKKDLVQVYYEDEWWDAKILRRKEDLDTYRYQVQYAFDASKQSGVEEDLIKPREEKVVKDPSQTAVELGLGADWEAVESGGKRWKITDPEGVSYKSKAAALKAYKIALTSEKEMEGGDPPFRTVGNEYIGRRVVWTHNHSVSARRTVAVDQVGKVTGYISETDVDQSGEPGFVSERTGKPAKLFHVVFDDDPSHPYVSYLVQSQDLEEYEISECVVEEDSTQSPAKKKARKR